MRTGMRTRNGWMVMIVDGSKEGRKIVDGSKEGWKFMNGSKEGW
jgi:hypothetical protein